MILQAWIIFIRWIIFLHARYQRRWLPFLFGVSAFFISFLSLTCVESQTLAKPHARFCCEVEKNKTLWLKNGPWQKKSIERNVGPIRKIVSRCQLEGPIEIEWNNCFLFIPGLGRGDMNERQRFFFLSLERASHAVRACLIPLFIVKGKGVHVCRRRGRYYRQSLPHW